MKWAILAALALLACAPAAPKLAGPATYCVAHETWYACGLVSWRWQSGADACGCDEACGPALHCPNGTACTLPDGTTGECESVGE